MRTPLSSIAFALATAFACVACDAPQEADDGPAATEDADRGPLGKADNFGSCEAVDGEVACGGHSIEGNCWCDDLCEYYGDCCADKTLVCDPEDPPLTTWRDALPQGQVDLDVWMEGTTLHTTDWGEYENTPPGVFHRCDITGQNPGDVEVICSPITSSFGILPATIQEDGTFSRSQSLGWRWSWSYSGHVTAEGELVIEECSMSSGHYDYANRQVIVRDECFSQLTGSF